MGAPIAEEEFVRARSDLAARRALMVRSLDLLLGRIALLRAYKPAMDSPVSPATTAQQLRDGIDLAVRLADRLQMLTKTLDGAAQPARAESFVRSSEPVAADALNSCGNPGISRCVSSVPAGS
ncbi:MAG TPA: hypothetical protein VNQ56_03040 [Pseudolabrys sp.]|nr:hypothetical protein [Pseudolabrys sp.]